MTRFFCDKCGEEMMSKTVTVKWETDNLKFVYFGKESEGEIDLCLNCLKRFINWVKNND